MARRRKTKAELRASGAFQHNPKRAVGRGDPPKPTGPLGRAPAHLRLDEKAVWNELAGIMPPGVVGNVDQFAVETLVRLVVKTRKRRAGASEQKMLLQLLGKFGMTPADRRRIEIHEEESPEQKVDDPWAEFFPRTGKDSKSGKKIN